MSVPLPASYYSDPEQALIEEQAKQIYREKGCAACALCDEAGRGLPRKLGKTPGRDWCEWFEEA